MTKGGVCWILGYCACSSFSCAARAVDKKGLTFSKTCNMSRMRLPASVVEGVVLVVVAMLVCVCLLFCVFRCDGG